MAGRKKRNRSLLETASPTKSPTMLSVEGANAKLLKNKKIGQNVTMTVRGKITRMQDGPFDEGLNGSVQISSMKIGGRKKGA